MEVKISNYCDDDNFVEYCAYGLSFDQMEFLNNNLDEETLIEEGVFKIKMYFDNELYPFRSDVAKFRLDDFIAREEIEMNVFLSSFLDDMQMNHM